MELKFCSYILILSFTLSSCVTENILNEDYFYIQKDKVREFRQIKDSLFITAYKKGVRDTFPKLKYKIIRGSQITDSSKIFYLDAQNRNKNSKITYKSFSVINYKNGRKGLSNIPGEDTTSKTELMMLYPKSELDGLKPITNITFTESQQIQSQFLKYIKETSDSFEIDFDDPKIWIHYNSLVIDMGYNPIGATTTISNKSE